MKNNLLSILAVVLSVFAVFYSYENKSVDADKVAVALKSNPKMIIEALQEAEAQDRAQRAEEAQAVIRDSLDEINNDPFTPFVGPKDAKVTFALFYDYSCGYCHSLYTDSLKEIIADNPDVKFVFKTLTFLGPNSLYAAKAAMAASEQGKFAAFNDALLSFKGQITEAKVDEFAAKVGMNVEEMKGYMESPTVEEALMGIRVTATKVQINAVPTMVLGGKLLQTFDRNQIQQEINALK